jgi:hypothetical protein
MDLNFWANLSAILTALVAVFAYGIFQWGQYSKLQLLQEYLKDEKVKGLTTATNKGQRSILHLIAKLGMTEAEILQASFRSKYIKRAISTNVITGMAADLLLEYNDNSLLSYPEQWRELIGKTENI